jgi:hypothetical protein
MQMNGSRKKNIKWLAEKFPFLPKRETKLASFANAFEMGPCRLINLYKFILTFTCEGVNNQLRRLTYQLTWGSTNENVRSIPPKHCTFIHNGYCKGYAAGCLTRT